LKIKGVIGLLLLSVLCSAQSIDKKLNIVNSDTSHAPSGSPYYSFFFVGDAGYAYEGSPVLESLKKQILQAGEESCLVFLGNNIYPKGLPDEQNKKYNDAESRILAQLKILDEYPGKVFFIPGNRDWARGIKKGDKYLENQEKFVEDYLDDANVFLPDDACPGPVEVTLKDDIVLIILDTRWLNSEHEFDRNEYCEYTDLETVDELKRHILRNLRDLILKNQDKKIIIAGHHPLKSAGNFGGHFHWPENIFPLLGVNKYLYIPLPGFLYTGYRSFLGASQDLAHPEYKAYRKSVTSILEEQTELIYVSGHEHNLQYRQIDNIHQVISGSGSKTGYAANLKDYEYTGEHMGFSKINVYSNGEIWLEFWAPDENTGEARIVYNNKLFTKPVPEKPKLEEEIVLIDFSDSTMIAPASLKYETKKIVRFLMGENYRDEWSQPIEVRVFDISKEKGGLEIIKRGGGEQTKSYRMQASDGKQYVLRSIEKYVETALPDEVQETFAVDVVQDGISHAHPYAAITVPPMADAAGVYHTNPEVVFVPDDPNLGMYRTDMANRLYLYEERPAGNWEDQPSFGYSKDIVSTGKVLKKTMDKHNHLVDQQWVLKSRTFDLLIGDWDRHEDQWRWASFKKSGKTIYRPIPRDRDQAYFKAEGPMIWIVNRKWAVRITQGFEYDIKDMGGLNFNGKFFDRSFLNQPSLEDWLRKSNDLQTKMTDSVIENGIKVFPEEIFQYSGEEIIDKLKVRREKLPEFSEELYMILARQVDVVGTDDRELFDVKRLNDGKTDLTVYGLNKKNKITDTIYHRIFNKEETKEVRLYGLNGKDKFLFTGDVNKGIKFRAIGGKGHDTFTDSSRVRGWSKKTLVYDIKGKNDLYLGRESRNLTSRNPDVNEYNRKQFKYNFVMPLVTFAYNVDDGIFIGGGAKISTFNFRDSTIQKITAQYAFATSSFNISYEGLFSSVFQGWDLIFLGEINYPQYTDNFFGLGNETVKETDDKDYYRVRYKYITANPLLRRRLNDNIDLQAGAFYLSGKVEDTPGRFISDFEESGLDSTIFDRYQYWGINLLLNIDTRNDKIFPQTGLLWNSEARYTGGITSNAGDFVKILSDLRYYFSFNKNPRTVFVYRIGGGMNFGQYEFYQANTLGGKTNLRGYQATRYSGDHSFYQNIEIRYKVANFKSYALTGHAGLVGFYDLGRVWYDGENSKKWHSGFGAGGWISPFKAVVVVLTYNWSVDDQMVQFYFNFLF